MAKLHKSKVKKNYGFLAVIFIALVVLLSLFIAYFAFTKTTLEITPTLQDVSVDFQISLADVAGTLGVLEKEGTKTTTELKTIGEKEDKARGKVTIYNKYSADQPLVETTRLLSTEGILFRTQETVTVPAGGQVEVEVAADQVGSSGNIGPSKFEIVALWPGLKDKIYAVSTAAMSGGLKQVKKVSQEDIDNLYAALEDELKAQINNEAAKSEILEKSTDAQAEAEVESLTATMKIKAIIPEYDNDKLLELAKAKLKEKAPSDLTLQGIYKKKDLQVELVTYDLASSAGTLKVVFTGQAVINASSDILDPANFIGKSETSIKNYLKNYKEIKSVEIKFSPFWLKKAPPLKDHIKIKINA